MTRDPDVSVRALASESARMGRLVEDEEREAVGRRFTEHLVRAVPGATWRSPRSTAGTRHHSEQMVRHLTTAPGTRHTTGLGRGLLLRHFAHDTDQSFTLLRQASQHTNRKLHDIAHELAAAHECGELDDELARQRITAVAFPDPTESRCDLISRGGRQPTRPKRLRKREPPVDTNG